MGGSVYAFSVVVATRHATAKFCHPVVKVRIGCGNDDPHRQREASAILGAP